MDDLTEKRIGLNGQFIDHGDGTVTDTRTGLMWKRAAEGQDWEEGKVNGKAIQFRFEESINNKIIYAGHCDWRIPTLQELQTIVDKTRDAPFIDLDVFPRTQNDRYISSTQYEYSRHMSYFVNFSSGTAVIFGRSGGFYLRLVRGKLQPQKLTLRTTGNGTGNIECNPALQTYEFGNTVALSASASENSIFIGWQGDMTGGDASCNLTMDAPKSVIAVFQLREFFALQIIMSGTGTGTTKCIPSLPQYEKGTLVTLEATPAEGSKFIDWIGDGRKVGSDFQVTVDKEKTVTAVFEKVPYFSLDVNMAGNGQGTVTRYSNSEIHEQQLPTYEFGSKVTLLARASEHSIFMGWQGDMTGDDASCNLTMDAPKSVIAVFQLREFFALQMMMSGTGTGTTECIPLLPQYEKGTIVTLKARPTAGSEFIDWIGLGRKVGSDFQVMMDKEKTITAVFDKVPYFPLAVNRVGNGLGTVTRDPNAESYEKNTVVRLLASAANGSRFAGWAGNVSSDITVCRVTMDSAKNVDAEFVLIEYYVLTTHTSGSGRGTIKRSLDAESYREGSTVTLTACAEDGSIFNGWQGDASAMGIQTSCTVVMNSSKNITAEFLSLNLPNLGITVRFDKVENATMKTGEAAYILYLSVANNGLKQMRVEIPFAHYINCQGEEIDQSVWLSGLLLGSKGSIIRAGAFRKMGLVFYKDRLPQISLGDHLYVSVLQAKPALRLNFIFRCTDNTLRQFTLIHAVAEDIQALDENGEVSSEKVELLQRITRLEESMRDILRRLDTITTLPVPVNKHCPTSWPGCVHSP